MNFAATRVGAPRSFLSIATRFGPFPKHYFIRAPDRPYDLPAVVVHPTQLNHYAFLHNLHHRTTSTTTTRILPVPKQTRATFATMASATNFFEFEPKDSMTSPILHLSTIQIDLFPQTPSPHYSSHECPLTDITLTEKGNPYPLKNLSGKVVLVVNTASKCGFTPQFEGLEKLYEELKEKHGDNIEFLGFPCNQFGGQDPGTNDEIQEFCLVNYGVSFPILGKIDVRS